MISRAIHLRQAIVMFGTDARIQQALDKAAAVWARQVAHELLCTERWGQVRKALEDLHISIRGATGDAAKGVRSIWWLILVCAGTLICGMAGLLATLVLTGHHGGG